MNRITIYKDKAGEFRWRCKSRNGKIVAESGEGYKREKACRSSLFVLILTVQLNEFTVKDSHNKLVDKYNTPI